jgi:hypothetical protein
VTLEAFSVHRCLACGLRYLKTPPPLEALPAYYDNVMGNLMRQAGIEKVLVVVPNGESRLGRRLGDAWFHWEPPRHLAFHTPDSLAALSSALSSPFLDTVLYAILEAA